MAVVLMKKRVLVVEDFRAICDIYEDALSGAGYEVRSASSGSEALRVLRLHPPDVLVLDLGLPDISGWDLLQTMRGTPALEDIPVVIITGDPEQTNETRGRALGCVSYIAKPVLLSDLIEMVDRALSADPVPLAIPA